MIWQNKDHDIAIRIIFNQNETDERKFKFVINEYWAIGDLDQEIFFYLTKDELIELFNCFQGFMEINKIKEV